MMDKSNIKEIVIKIMFQDEKMKHERLIQELQNTCELKKLQNIKIEIENKNENDFLSRFFSGGKSKSAKNKVDCFV
ncbi:TPA: hypothetical protein KQG32_003010 [Clostridioides difficile]|uniref:hypothetical protein n=1 Tax=Clostridioides sp. ZZV14-6345 TaxID=2811496 RepID=UPI001C187EC0|nr:hypothetical protein [Clostridioides sp. ZZV14-6345]HBG5350069.1 hypothetical protein [Clostridioides difficile]